jgi:hypothetical protein
MHSPDNKNYSIKIQVGVYSIEFSVDDILFGKKDNMAFMKIGDASEYDKFHRWTKTKDIVIPDSAFHHLSKMPDMFIYLMEGDR